jgi:hypothetical protein
MMAAAEFAWISDGCHAWCGIGDLKWVTSIFYLAFVSVHVAGLVVVMMMP